MRLRSSSVTVRSPLAYLRLSGTLPGVAVVSASAWIGAAGPVHGRPERGVDRAGGARPAPCRRTPARRRRRREVVAGAGGVDDLDVGVGQRGQDRVRDVIGGHRRLYSTDPVDAEANTLPTMTLGTRVTVVTTLVIASVLAVSGYAALKVRRAEPRGRPRPGGARDRRRAARRPRAARPRARGRHRDADAAACCAAREHDELFKLEILQRARTTSAPTTRPGCC